MRNANNLIVLALIFGTQEYFHYNLDAHLLVDCGFFFVSYLFFFFHRILTYRCRLNHKKTRARETETDAQYITQ